MMDFLIVLLLGLLLFFAGATIMLMALVREYKKLLENKEPLEPIQFWRDEDE